MVAASCSAGLAQRIAGGRVLRLVSARLSFPSGSRRFRSSMLTVTRPPQICPPLCWLVRCLTILSKSKNALARLTRTIGPHQVIVSFRVRINHNPEPNEAALSYPSTTATRSLSEAKATICSPIAINGPTSRRFVTMMTRRQRSAGNRRFRHQPVRLGLVGTGAAASRSLANPVPSGWKEAQSAEPGTPVVREAQPNTSELTETYVFHSRWGFSPSQ